MVCVVDSHHKVLLSWAKYRKTLDQSPRLITLDHHTDTSAPFRKHLLKENKDIKLNDKIFLKLQSDFLKDLNYSDLESVKKAISKLNNDEHIITAIKTDIINSAFVIAHGAQDTDLNIFKEHRIVCSSVEEVISDNGYLKPNHNTVLESSVLLKAFNKFNLVLEQSDNEKLDFNRPYILDIDLDYFNTFKSIDPDDGNFFRQLLKNAGLITIATEPEYVKMCSVDEALDSQYLMNVMNEKFLNDK